MTEKKTRSDQAADLRRRAEEKARADEGKTLDTLPPEEARQVLHELRVHQIELEMQNEELRRAQAELGLCISKHLAEALGGAIEVSSEPGKGSTFSVTIDPGPLDGIHMLENAQEAVTEPPSPTQPADADKIALCSRILLAEDGPDNQRLIALLLRKAGAQVSTVDNGQLAVEAVLAAHEAGEPFDVILMDMQMPVLDGYEATRQLRKRGYTAPIIALTAHAMAEDCQKCLDVGCNDYLPKPIDRQKLLATIAPWAARASTDSPTAQDNAQAFAASLPLPEALVKATR